MTLGVATGVATEFAPHLERLMAVASGQSGRVLALAGERDPQRGPQGTPVQLSTVHILQLPKRKTQTSIPLNGPVFALAFAGADASLLAVGTGQGELRIYPVSTGSQADPTPLCSITAHTGPLRALSADPLGRFLLSAGDDGALCLWQVVQKGAGVGLEPLGRRVLSTRPLRAAALSLEDGMVATAGDDGIITTLPIDGFSSAPVREMPCGDGGIGALCFMQDDRIAAGCADGSVHFCFLHGDVDDENRSGEQGHSGPIQGLFLSQPLRGEGASAPRRLFSLALDGSLKSWPLDSRRPPRTLDLPTVGASALTWIPAPKADETSPGGKLVVVSRDRSVFFVPLGQNLETLDAPLRLGSELDRLSEGLSAKSPKVRQPLVEALEPIAEDEARVLLDRALLSDVSSEIRRDAARIMGRTGRRLSRPALRRALDDGQADVRHAALQALIQLEGDTSLAPLRAALASRQPDIRQKALELLPPLRSVSPLVPSLITERLSDDAATVRRTAFLGLLRLGGDTPLEPLRAALSRGPADVRILALQQLSVSPLLRQSEGQSLLERALEDDDATVRATAMAIAIEQQPRLAKILRARDARLYSLLQKLEQDRLATGLPPLASPQSASESEASLPPSALSDAELQPLFVMMASRHSEMAWAGALSLGILGDPRAVGAQLQLSRERTDDKVSAVNVLAQTARAMPTEERLISRLEWLMDDADANQRAAAFAALKDLASPRGAPALFEVGARALRSSREDIRVQALQILVHFGGKGAGQGKWAHLETLSSRADDLLSEALDDEAEKVRREAFRTLWTWHKQNPEIPLRRAVLSAHADIRLQAVEELARLKAPFAHPLLIERTKDSASRVGIAAYKALLEDKNLRKKADIHKAALESPRADVRALACKECREAPPESLRDPLVQGVRDPNPLVHLAAIEAIDQLLPQDVEAFDAAFQSIFYGLQVRAAELCGKRRDARAVGPMTRLLSIPPTHLNFPTAELRQRATRALADVGDPDVIPFFVGLLEDPDGLVQEMAARGLATAARPGDEQPLVDALSHAALAVRSWAGEGLARLGDRRALPVLTGTLKNPHLPLRKGAIIALCALGAEGIGGILQGLEDENRELQDFVFAVILARDIALARAGLAPDLLTSALASTQPEIRFAAARALELRLSAALSSDPSGDAYLTAVLELVGPARLEKASEMKRWPEPARRVALLQAVIAFLASDLPSQRYAAAQVLVLRNQPDIFWQEAKRLAGPAEATRGPIPHTTWADEARQERKSGWIRSVFSRSSSQRPAEAGLQGETPTERVLTVLRFAGATQPRAVPPSPTQPISQMREAETLYQLAFGTYTGIVRQLPAPGQADETQRIRRDCIDRLVVLSARSDISRAAVLPTLRRAIDDPHHLVRKAAVQALRGLYAAEAIEPLVQLVSSHSPDVGRIGVDELIRLALTGTADARAQARTHALATLQAPHPEVRAYALAKLPRLFPARSLDPWLLALACPFADVRLSVVDKLLTATDARVTEALAAALSSDHEDLRLKVSVALARRGDLRTVDVLASFLRSEDRSSSQQALDALLSLAHSRTGGGLDASRAAAAATVIAGYLDDDPDKTADRASLIRALGRIGHPAGADVLLRQLTSDEGTDAETLRKLSFEALMAIARDRLAPPLLLKTSLHPEGLRRRRYQETLALQYLGHAASSRFEVIRQVAANLLGHLDSPDAELLLTRLIDDRAPAVRVAACEALALRAEQLQSVSTGALSSALRTGRRELILPAAQALGAQKRPEAFQALMLLFKAGTPPEREQALISLGLLGDRRVLEEILPWFAPRTELSEEDKPLLPCALEALGALLPSLTSVHIEDATRVRTVLEHQARLGDESLRAGALAGLRRAGDARSRALLETIALDTDDDGDLRLQAVEELERLAAVESQPTLLRLLRDDDEALAERALEALKTLTPGQPGGGAVVVYVEALRSPHETLQDAAAEYLARHGDPVQLISHLATIPQASIRQQLRQGILRRGLIPTSVLPSLLLSEAPEARAEAAWLAGASGDVTLRQPLEQHFGTLEMQWRQAKAAGGLLTEKDAAEDDDDMDDETPDPRRVRLEACTQAWLAGLWAAERLKAQVTPQAISAAQEISAPVTVRVQALRTLATLGGAASTFQTCLTDSNAEVRRAAAAALAQLNGPQDSLPRALATGADTALLEKALVPGKSPERLSAIAALGQLGNTRVIKGLEQLLETTAAGITDEETVRVAVFKALQRAKRVQARAARWGEG